MKDWHFFYIMTALFPFIALPVWFAFSIPWEAARAGAALGMVGLLAMTLWLWRVSRQGWN